MAINSLFDKGRRERLRDAVKRGELEKALRKPLKEDLETTRFFPLTPPEPEPPTRLAPAPAPPAPAWNPATMQHSQVLALGGFQHPNPVDQSLFDAIQAGDLAKVMDAINQGANLNSKYPHVPAHRAGDCVIFSNTTPLEYAKKKGNPAIIRLLEHHGAKD